MLTKFALDLLSEVAEECNDRGYSLAEPEEKRNLFKATASKITKLVESLNEEK